MTGRQEAYIRARVDDAFLFVISLVNLVLAFLTATLGGADAILRFSPLFITGLAWPFYIGYVRGAISDTIPERVRGWVYFCLGSSVWLALLVVTIVRDYYPQVSDSLFVSVYFVYSVVSAIGLLASYRVAMWITVTTHTKLLAKEKAAIANGALGAVLLSFSFFVGLDQLRLFSFASHAPEPEGVLVLLLNPWWPFLALCFFTFVILERVTTRLAVTSTQLGFMPGEIAPDLLSEKTSLAMMFTFASGGVCFLVGLTSHRLLFWWTILSFLAAVFSPVLGLGSVAVSVLAVIIALKVRITIPTTDFDLRDQFLRMFRPPDYSANR